MLPALKQRTPRPDPRWQYVTAVTREFLARWEAGFAFGIADLRDDASVAEIARALESGEVGTLVQNLPWAASGAALQRGWRPLLEEVLQRAGTVEMRRLNLPIRFDLDNPFALRWIEQHAAELVVEVTDQTKRAIRNVVLQGFEQGRPPRRFAMRIREMVGLTSREALAVERRWATLAGTDRSARRVDEMTDTYSRRLLRRRAERIARTETINSAANGLHQSQLQARDQGFLDPAVKRMWIAAPGSARTCPICVDLHGQRVGLEEPFYSNILGRSVMNPTAHPRCRCTTGIVLDEEDGE